MKDNIIDMVLTSIVNNREILKSINLDMQKRFDVNLDMQKLENYLAAIELEAKSTSIS
jgi:hypothetical protein